MFDQANNLFQNSRISDLSFFETEMHREPKISL